MEQHPLYLRNPEGLTVAQLKGWLAEWPEIDETGEPTRVWMKVHGNFAVFIGEVQPMDLRSQGGGSVHMLLGCNVNVDQIHELLADWEGDGNP